jgi:hypothetical protein
MRAWSTQVLRSVKTQSLRLGTAVAIAGRRLSPANCPRPHHKLGHAKGHADDLRHTFNFALTEPLCSRGAVARRPTALPD